MSLLEGNARQVTSTSLNASLMLEAPQRAELEVKGTSQEEMV